MTVTIQLPPAKAYAITKANGEIVVVSGGYAEVRDGFLVVGSNNSEITGRADNVFAPGYWVHATTYTPPQTGT